MREAFAYGKCAEDERMPRSSNQKLKLLYLLKILSEETDEQHYMNARELIARLGQYGILSLIHI